MDQPIQPSIPAEPGIYDLRFMATFAANVTLMSAASLLFRYADFVTTNGGNELHLGWIVGAGTIGAILIRIVQGIAIDRIGTKTVWILSLLLFVFGALWHTQISNVHTWQVYIARMILASGIAGALGSWLTFASLRVPQHRVAEMIGVVGSSGFIGMAIGPTIGDLLLGGSVPTIQGVNQMFLVAALLGACSLVCAWLANYGLKFNPSNIIERPWTTIVRYRPGFLLVVAITMGMGGSIPSTFVRPFALSLDINSLAIYFWTYNVMAFSCRIVFRHASQRIGLTMMTILGLTLMLVSLLMYLWVSNYWWLILPAIFAGISHAFLFPAVMTAGSACFPEQHRGLAMNFMFAMYDLGLFVGAPLIGVLLWSASRLGLPPYSTMFVLLAAWIAMVAIIYARIAGEKTMKE